MILATNKYKIFYIYFSYPLNKLVLFTKNILNILLILLIFN